MQTLPQVKIFKTINEFIAKIDIILTSVFPENYNHSIYSYDWNGAIYKGPFIKQDLIFIEQQQTDKALF